jgi:aryl-alcohol dehydrogenase-like predicted oxidoreductase
MPTRTGGKTGLALSTLEFGGAPIGYPATGREQRASILQLLLECGVDLIDTAAASGQQRIGRPGGRISPAKIRSGHQLSSAGTLADNEAWSHDALSQSASTFAAAADDRLHREQDVAP